MIQIESNNSDLKSEAKDLVKAIHADPAPEELRRAMGRLKEIAVISPRAVYEGTNGDLYQFSVGLITDALNKHPDKGKTSVVGIQVDAKLRDLLHSLAGDNPSPAIRLAAESACFAYLEYWLTNCAAAMARSKDKPVYPELNRRQAFTQRRFLRALETVEAIRALNRPKRIAMEI